MLKYLSYFSKEKKKAFWQFMQIVSNIIKLPSAELAQD